MLHLWEFRDLESKLHLASDYCLDVFFDFLKTTFEFFHDVDPLVDFLTIPEKIIIWIVFLIVFDYVIDLFQSQFLSAYRLSLEFCASLECNATELNEL